MKSTETATQPLLRVLALLENVRPHSTGWTALCPAHGDQNPSLSIAEGDDGRVLIHCFSGCDITDVVAAIGLEVRDLFPRKQVKSRRKGVTWHGPHS